MATMLLPLLPEPLQIVEVCDAAAAWPHDVGAGVRVPVGEGPPPPSDGLRYTDPFDPWPPGAAPYNGRPPHALHDLFTTPRTFNGLEGLGDHGVGSRRSVVGGADLETDAEGRAVILADRAAASAVQPTFKPMFARDQRNSICPRSKTSVKKETSNKANG